MRVAVLGAGGVGGLLACILASSGARVTCLARQDTTAILRAEGLRLSSAKYGNLAVKIAADTRLRHRVDLCIVAVKATHLEAALERAPPSVMNGGIIVPMLNGLDHMPLIRNRYGGEHVAAATIRVESVRVAPGHIEHLSPFALVQLASSTLPAEILRSLGARLSGYGVDVSVRDDELAMLWEKLLFLAPLALLTCRYEASLGTVRTRWREQMNMLVAELAAVAEAAGVRTDSRDVMKALDSAPADMKSSMLRDALAGAPLELDAIGGAVLRQAACYGIDTPTVATMVAGIGSGLG